MQSENAIHLVLTSAAKDTFLFLGPYYCLWKDTRDGSRYATLLCVQIVNMSQMRVCDRRHLPLQYMHVANICRMLVEHSHCTSIVWFLVTAARELVQKHVIFLQKCVPDIQSRSCPLLSDSHWRVGPRINSILKRFLSRSSWKSTHTVV
jgi:hypothetical protein